MALGVMEIGIMATVVVLMFGAKKVPELARGLGQSIREFRSASREPAPDAASIEEVKA